MFSAVNPLSTPRLPLELLASVVEEAVASLVDDQRWNDAAPLCLLSTDLAPFARAALYRTLTLIPAHEPSLDTRVDTPALYVSLNRKLLKTLGTNLDLGPLVREIRLQTLGWPDAEQQLRAELHETFRLCHNLVHFNDISIIYLPWLSAALAFEGMSQFGASTLSASALYALSPMSPTSLHWLVPSGTSTPPCWLAGPIPLKVYLTFMEACGGVTFPRVVARFLALSNTSLRHLTFPFPGDDEPLLDLSGFSNLISLRLTGLYVDEAYTAAGIRKILSTSPSLSHLVLEAPDRHSQDVAGYLGTTELLLDLPPSLVSLDVRTLPFSFSALLAYLQPVVSPSLRRLDVQPFENEHKQIHLQKACWSRGVELYSFSDWEWDEEDPEGLLLASAP